MLPVEVFDHILQDVQHVHKQSLQSCALVSHAFLSLTRQFLFRDIRLALEPDLLTDPNDPEKSSPSRFHQFVTFLLAKSGQVASHVRSLTINKKGWRKVDLSTEWQTSAQRLGTILPKLTRLIHLSIQVSILLDWTRSNDELRDILMRFCRVPTLQSLEVSCMGLKKEEWLSFTTVPSLKLICIDVLEDAKELSSSSGLEECNSEQEPPPQDSTSESTTQPTQLCDLTLAPKYAADGSSEIWSIVQASQTQLKSFRCYSSPYDYCLHRSFDFIELEKFPKLETFAICINLAKEGSISKLVTLFSPLQSRQGSTASSAAPLKYLEICCDIDLYTFPSEETLGSWDWHALDVLLTDVALGNVEAVAITVKKVIRGYNSAKRDYKTLEGRLLEVFRQYLPETSGKKTMLAGAPGLSYE